MATFLRAIKAGVIHFQHSVTLLTHYGRLGPVFDQCSKIIVEILREEGMYKSNGEAVVQVVFQALREVGLPYSKLVSHAYLVFSPSCSILTVSHEAKSIPLPLGSSLLPAI